MKTHQIEGAGIHQRKPVGFGSAILKIISAEKALFVGVHRRAADPARATDLPVLLASQKPPAL